MESDDEMEEDDEIEQDEADAEADYQPSQFIGQDYRAPRTRATSSMYADKGQESGELAVAPAKRTRLSGQRDSSFVSLVDDESQTLAAESCAPEVKREVHSAAAVRTVAVVDLLRV